MKLLDDVDELRKLRAEADRRTAALIPALFHEMFGEPGTNSKGLPMRPFGELVSNQDGRRKPVKASDRAERQGKYPYYGASGIIDYVEEYLFDDLLIGEDGANLLARSTPIALLARGEYWVNNHTHVVTYNGNADLTYLCAAPNLRDLTDYVTGSAQPKLNQANLNRMPIPVPSLPRRGRSTSAITESVTISPSHPTASSPSAISSAWRRTTAREKVLSAQGGPRNDADRAVGSLPHLHSPQVPPLRRDLSIRHPPQSLRILRHAGLVCRGRIAAASTT